MHDLPELVVKPGLETGHRDEFTFDDHGFHSGTSLYRASRPDGQIGDFSLFQRSHFIGYSEDLGWIDGQGFDSILFRQSMSHGNGRWSCDVAHVAASRAIPARIEREHYPFFR